MDKSIYSRDYNVFLRHLRKAREQAGMTQTELGRRLNSTQSFVPALSPPKGANAKVVF